MRRATPRQHRSYLGTVHDASSHLDRRPVVEYLVYIVHVATGMRQNSQPRADVCARAVCMCQSAPIVAVYRLDLVALSLK